MGNSQFLSNIKEKKISIDQSLLNCSSSKLRQYYSSYKSICESFSITISEFIQIFGHNQKAFQAFDPKKKGRIDAIEMFTGLIIFSSINYQQKIKFLFEIFDFNEEGWLSYEAVTFLLVNVCNSTYKIFSISQTANSKEIQAFLNEYFYEESEIGLQKFIKWSRRIQEFMVFFNIIEHDFQPYFELKKIDKLKPQFSREKCLQYKQEKNLLEMNSPNHFNRSGDIFHTFLSKKVLKDATDKSIKDQKTELINLLFQNQPNPKKGGKENHKAKENVANMEKDNKDSKKIGKTKFNINFEFDKKFVEVLETLVAPYEEKGQSDNSKMKNEERGNEKEVNFNFSNPQYGENDDEIDSSQSQDQLQEQTFNPSLKWLYGINLSIPHSVKFLQTSDPKASNQLFIYTLNHTIILYYNKINIQKHYIHHRNPISTFQISHNREYIASADFGEDFDIDFPEIHVWRIRDRKPMMKWKHVQKGKVHRLAWVQGDRSLVAVSYFEGKWAVKVLDLMNQGVVLSTYIEDVVMSIARRPTEHGHKSLQFNPIEFVDLIECKSIKKSKLNNKSMNQPSTYLLIYTYTSVTLIYPNEEQDPSSTSSQQSSSPPTFKQFSMVTKLLCESESFLTEINKLNNLFGKEDTKAAHKVFPSLINLVEFQEDKFIGVHNDKKIRVWNKSFEHYEIPYARRESERPFVRVMLYTIEDGSQSRESNITSNINKSTGNGLLRRSSSQKQGLKGIKQMSSLKSQKTKILIILDEQKIELMNLVTNESRFIEIPDSLYNLMLIDMEIVETRKKQTELIVVSLFGDVIRVMGLKHVLQNITSKSKLQQPHLHKAPSHKKFQQFAAKRSDHSSQSSSQNSYQHRGPSQQPHQKVTFKKYYQLFWLQNCKDYYFYDEYCLILADKLIYKINSDEKELTSLISFDHQLKAISGFGNYYALLTENGPQYVFVMQNDHIVEKIRLAQRIQAIKLIPTHLILCSQKYIQVYTKSYQKYLTAQSKRVAIQGSCPVDICSTQNPFKFIIITQDRQVYHLQIKNNQFRYKKVKTNQMNTLTYTTQGYNTFMMESYLEIVYPHLNDSFAMIFYPQQKFLSVGMSNGDVRVWSDLKRVKNNSEANMEYYELLGHQGPVKKMRLRFYEAELQMVTVGEKDGMIAVYNHFDYLIGDKDKPSPKQLTHYFQQQQLFNPYLDEITLNTFHPSQNTSNNDTFKQSISLLKDSQLSISMFEESVQSWARDVISKIVFPSTSNYESLSGESEQARANLISLQVDHVYGFVSERVRHSVGYVHKYAQLQKKIFGEGQVMVEQNSSLQNKETAQNSPTFSPFTKLSFANNTLLPLNQQHQCCKRQVIYFIDRLVILFSPQTRKQRVYSFHKNQVTSLQTHPNKYLVCSAQKAITNPVIHIWNSENLVLVKAIKTKHKGGAIFCVEFSRQATYVLTLAGHSSQESLLMDNKGGFMSNSNNYSSLNMNTSATRNTYGMQAQQSLSYISVEVIEWKYSNSILYRVLLHQLIFSVKFNPYSETEICFGGRNSLKIYSFESGNLVVKENLYEFAETITSLVYSSALYGTDIQSDIIVGTMEGNVALYICGKLIKIKKIHQASVNFISLNQLFKYKTIVITGGEDSFVKIWDTKFNLLGVVNVRQQLLLSKQQNDYTSYNFSPQSVDFFSCYPQKSSQVLNQYIFLIGTRSGHILQCKITSQYQGLKQIDDKKVSFIKEKLSLQVKTLVTNNNFINGGTQFQLCGNKLMITYSINSTVIFLWNYKKNELITFKKLKACPSIIKYDQNTRRVMIGYFKHSQIDVYKVGEDELTHFEEFSIKNDYYPDNITFSHCNTYLAVSLVLPTHPLQGTTTSYIATSSCIQIYEYKDGWKNNNTTQSVKKQYELKYRIDHTTRKKGSVLSMGINSCVWMGFSSTGQQLIALYSQKRIAIGHHTSTNSRFLKDQPFALRDNFIVQTLVSSQQAEKISKNSQFVMYSIAQKKQKQYAQQDFNQLNFYPFIKVNYLYYQKIKSLSTNNHSTLQNTTNQKGNSINEVDLLHPLVSQMAQYQKFIILGTTAGEVLFIHSDFFCSTHKKNSNPKTVCKYFKLFSTPVTKITIQNDRLFISSAKNNSILNIKILHSQNALHTVQLKDQFNQAITQEYLQRQVKLIYPKRQYIYESRLNFFDNDANLLEIQDDNSCSDDSNDEEHQHDQHQGEMHEKKNHEQQDHKKQPKKRIHLQLYSAIGRNAIYKRNNIFVDLRENIISHTGCNLLILKRAQQPVQKPNNLLTLPTATNNFLTTQKQVLTIEQPVKRNNYTQEFLKLDVSPFSTFAEISCIAMSEDRRVIVAGTNEDNAKILVWDISTKTNLKQISLKSMISIRKLGISPSNQRLGVIALNKKGETILFFIQITEENILAAYSFSSQHQEINEIKFFPQSEFSFLLCGNNYMAEWKYNGILTFEHYNIENPSDFIEMGQKNLTSNLSNFKKNQSNVIFYSISFLKNILISAGSDGYLYIWNDKKIIKKQNAHPKSAILCLYASSSSKIFASGGADGKAIVWQLSSSSIIQKIFQFSIYHGREQKIPIRYHIQSVCISKNNIIVGTRAGEIYEFLCNDLEEIEKMKEEWKKGVNLILPAYDDDVINSISFNTSSQKLFMITQMGCFSVFDIQTLSKIKQEKIDIGKSDIIKMIACKLSYRIFIVLKNSVLVYYYMHNKEEKIQKFRKGKENFKTDNGSFIKNAIMSANQKYLALLIASAQMDLYSIQLYDLTQADGAFFKESKILDHIPTNVQVIDFSTDNEYLICKNTQDEETIVHLSTHQTINPNTIQFELQYTDQAKKTSKNIRDILQLYGEQNQLLKIAQVMNHSIIATDEMGSVRVFEYPVVAGSNSKDKMDVAYYRFYVQHLNQVHLCVLSQDCRLLATVGKEDRTLFLWKVKEV